jgi:SP family general alpha glucoside:H+ symporter-like MFS transporter
VAADLIMGDVNSITGVDHKTNAILTETEADMKANNNATLNEAKAATEKEHKMTLMEGLRLYPKAVGWSLLISTCIAMEGFDLALVNGLYGFAQWRQKYGELQPDGGYEVSAAWQAGLSNGANVGSIIGLFINGWISERFGYRYTIISCLVLLMGFTTIFFTAQNVQTLLVAEILCGIPVCFLATSYHCNNADNTYSGVSSRLLQSHTPPKSAL